MVGRGKYLFLGSVGNQNIGPYLRPDYKYVPYPLVQAGRNGAAGNARLPASGADQTQFWDAGTGDAAT